MCCYLLLCLIFIQSHFSCSPSLQNLTNALTTSLSLHPHRIPSRSHTPTCSTPFGISGTSLLSDLPDSLQALTGFALSLLRSNKARPDDKIGIIGSLELRYKVGAAVTQLVSVPL